MASASGRPFTSVFASQQSATPAQKGPGSDGPDPGLESSPENSNSIPSLTHLLNVLGGRGPWSRNNLHTLFLGPLAVDQSSIIGHGASFTTYKRPVYRQPAIQARKIRLDNNEGPEYIIQAHPKFKSHGHVVYKVARVNFSKSGETTPDTQHSMKAVLMEIHSLLHPPLREHENIIKLLGIAWGFNYFDQSHRMPVLVVELATHGTLADLQATLILPSKTRSDLAIDVGEGLKILHRCGIIHGDVKSENILIFSHSVRGYIAKISDFGLSVVEQSIHTDIYIGGTRPWKAPETKAPVPRHLLHATDVYSYGLLLWRLATNGRDPFRCWNPSTETGERYLQDLEKIKQADQPIHNVSLERWFIAYLQNPTLTSSVHNTDETIDETVSRVVTAFSSLQLHLHHVDSEGLDGGSVPRMWLPLEDSMQPEQIFEDLLQCAHKDLFYGKISSALAECLSVDPSHRDLDSAIDALQHERRKPDRHQGNDDSGVDMVLRVKYSDQSVSFTRMKTLHPAVQGILFECYRAKVESGISRQSIDAALCFVLASFYISGYGTVPNYDEGRKLISLSSNTKFDFLQAKAYACRIHQALDNNFVPTMAMLQDLCLTAVVGSRIAQEDVKKLAPDYYHQLKLHSCRVRARLLSTLVFPDGNAFTFPGHDWDAMFAAALERPRTHTDGKHSSDDLRDSETVLVLHAAATSGKMNEMEQLLRDIPLSVNQLNHIGETPLLCACRTGKMHIVYRLLDLGADASIVASNGESCLHWLSSFEDDQVEDIGKALVKAGAPLRQFTRASVPCSLFPSGMDVEHHQPGSPLAWAVDYNRPKIVQFLLDEAQDPSICMAVSSAHNPVNAILRASMFHHVECLRIMIAAMKDANVGFAYVDCIRTGAHAADTFSMILRHGPKYKQILGRFFDYLLFETRHIIFQSDGYRLLHHAVQEGHAELVEYLLSPHVADMLAPPPEDGFSVPDAGAYHPSDINRGYGETGYTPLLHAISANRRSLVELLIARGADPKLPVANPFARDEHNRNWTGLHVLASACHNRVPSSPSSLAAFLIQKGLPVDGFSQETPFLVAIQHNGFNLATGFVHFGADVNALSLDSGFISLDHPTTVLGHLIAASAQNTLPRLQYLLYDCPGAEDVDFIVVPEIKLSALHRAALGRTGIYHRSWLKELKTIFRPGSEDKKVYEDRIMVLYASPVDSSSAAADGLVEDTNRVSDVDRKKRSYLRGDYDMVVNRDIMRTLLEKWNSKDLLNMKSLLEGRTALHLAVFADNVGAVELLIQYHADMTIVDDSGRTPLQLAHQLIQDSTGDSGDLADLIEIVNILEESCAVAGLEELMVSAL